MSELLQKLESRRVGLALSGGSVRGIAHIGVIKALAEAGIRPQIVAGTSVGSLVGAGLASGMTWQDLAQMAREVFWPSLLHGPTIEEFCRQRLPCRFEDLTLPFAAVATGLPSKKPVTLTSGYLASAINASCALPVRRPVMREGQKLMDGGVAGVLPVLACRELGADFVIASDVWAFSAFLRVTGRNHLHPRGRRRYPKHYLQAAISADLLIHPAIRLDSYLPVPASIERMIASGERAARRALLHLVFQPAA